MSDVNKLVTDAFIEGFWEAYDDGSYYACHLPCEPEEHSKNLAAKYVAKHIEQPPSAWISVEDRLPESGPVLICFGEPSFGGVSAEIGVGYYDNPNDYVNPNDGEGWKFLIPEKKVLGYGVTHWQPLPQPPELKESE